MGRCVSVSQIMLSSKAEGPVGAFGGGPKCWAGMRGLSSGTAGPSDTTRSEHFKQRMPDSAEWVRAGRAWGRWGTG